MAIIDDINVLLADNANGDISEKDMRDAFALGLGAVQHKKISTGEIQVEVAGGFTTILTSTFATALVMNLKDGAEHVIKFVMKAGSADIVSSGDWGWMQPDSANQAGSPVRLELGSLGGTPNSTLKLWVDDGALVTIKKNDPNDITSPWHVTHVELQGGHAHVASLPVSPIADGVYNLNIAGGVATWVVDSSADAPLIIDGYMLGSSVNDDVTLSIYHKFNGLTEETRNDGIDLTDGQEYQIQPMYQDGLTDAHILDSVSIFVAKSFADQSHTTPHPDAIFDNMGNAIKGIQMKNWINSGAVITLKYDSVFGGIKAISTT